MGLRGAGAPLIVKRLMFNNGYYVNIRGSGFMDISFRSRETDDRLRSVARIRGGR